MNEFHIYIIYLLWFIMICLFNLIVRVCMRAQYNIIT